MQGLTDPNVAVSLSPTGLSTTADGAGAFHFDNVALALGANAFAAVATDVAGNQTDFLLTLQRVPASSVDATPPALTAALLHDTGISSSDGITIDPTIAGSVTDEAGGSGLADLLGGLDGAPSASFVSLLSLVQGNGAFQLGASAINQLAGGPIADGAHTLHLVASDVAGNASSIDVSFTLKTTTPTAPTFDLVASDVFGSSSNHQTQSSSITLVGQADPNVSLTLLSTGATTLASNTGKFQFANVAVALGDNPLTVKASDAAGNSNTFSLTVNRVVATAIGDAAVQWNKITLQAIQNDGSTPEFASRGLAIESLAVYDSLNALNGTPGYLVSMTAPAGASADAAVAAAAHKALVYLYPAQKAALDALFATALATIPDGQAKIDGVALGEAVANQVIAARVNDGWNAFVTYDGGTGVGQWQSTGPMYLPAENPQWATLPPFAMTSPDQSRPDGPPSLTSADYAAAVNETKSLGSATSATRTADQTQIARFWADGQGTYTPPGAWNEIAEEASVRQGNSLTTDARLFAELDVAEADAAIAAWDAKYTYGSWRPVSAIQNADTIGNAAITQDANWQSLLITPPFPEYISGHSTFSAAAAEVLTSFFGSNYAFSTTSTSLLGVTRSFTSFWQAAQEAGESRIYGGIHFEFSNQDGLATGQKIGDWTLQAFDLTQDKQPPKLTVDQSSGLVTNHSPIITGGVIDNLSGVASLQAKFDGGSFASVYFDQQGKFSLPTNLATDGTADGQHTITLQATDAAGNAATPSVFAFTLDTKAPAITLASGSIQDGGTLSPAGTNLTGAADPTGSTLTALSYRFDSGTVVPISFNATTGAFDQTLDMSSLGIGAHTLTLSARDGAGNTTLATLNVTLPNLVPLTVVGLTPINGAADIGVTYRPKVTFSRGVNVATLTSDSFFATDSTGTKVDATIVPSADGTFASLFFTNPLPGASTITLHVQGEKIRGVADGVFLDAAGSGTAGSDLTQSYTTVSTTAVANTSITGRVVDPGPDLQPMTFDDVRAGPDQILHTADDVYLIRPWSRRSGGLYRCPRVLHPELGADRRRQDRARRHHRHQCARGVLFPLNGDGCDYPTGRRQHADGQHGDRCRAGGQCYGQIGLFAAPANGYFTAGEQHRADDDYGAAGFLRRRDDSSD